MRAVLGFAGGGALSSKCQYRTAPARRRHPYRVTNSCATSDGLIAGRPTPAFAWLWPCRSYGRNGAPAIGADAPAGECDGGSSDHRIRRMHRRGWAGVRSPRGCSAAAPKLRWARSGAVSSRSGVAGRGVDRVVGQGCPGGWRRSAAGGLAAGSSARSVTTRRHTWAVIAVVGNDRPDARALAWGGDDLERAVDGCDAIAHARGAKSPLACSRGSNPGRSSATFVGSRLGDPRARAAPVPREAHRTSLMPCTTPITRTGRPASSSS